MDLCRAINAKTQSGWAACQNDNRCKIISPDCNVAAEAMCMENAFPVRTTCLDAKAPPPPPPCRAINAKTQSGWAACQNDNRCKVISPDCNVAAEAMCREKAFPVSTSTTCLDAKAPPPPPPPPTYTFEEGRKYPNNNALPIATGTQYRGGPTWLTAAPVSFCKAWCDGNESCKTIRVNVAGGNHMNPSDGNCAFYPRNDEETSSDDNYTTYYKD
jgi:hypothetical protein